MQQNALSNSLWTLQQTFLITNAALAASLSSNQLALKVAESNLEIQTKQLSDVTYWVQNLYNNMTLETIVTSDRSRTGWRIGTNGINQLTVLLQKAPIVKSVEVYLKDARSFTETRMPSDAPFFRNILLLKMQGYDTNNTTVSVRYVADIRETNLCLTMPAEGDSFEMYRNGSKSLSE